MKKTIFLLLFFVFSAASFSQTNEQLAGTWVSVEEESDKDMEMKSESFYVFSSGSKVTFKGNARVRMLLDDKNALEYAFSFSADGKYTLSSGRLETVFDADSFQMKEEKNTLPGIFRMMLINPLKSEIKKEVRKPSSMTITSYTGDELRLRSDDEKDGDTTVFRRVN